jgi:CopG family nickel-responsive transcriptional regulator
MPEVHVPNLIRFSFSIEEELFKEFEKLMHRKNYANRSEFIRDLLREKIVQSKIEENKPVVGTISLIYDHRKRDLSQKLTHIQHEHHAGIIASTHVHLDADMCAEAIMVKGCYAAMLSLVDELGQQKGVVHSSLSVGALDKENIAEEVNSKPFECL